MLPEPHPDVVFQNVQDDVVLVHLGTSAIYALNRTGARFWELLTAGRSRTDVVRILAEEFATDAAVVEREIDEMIHALKTAGLVA